MNEKKKQKLRWTLMLGGPLLVVVIGLAVYLQSGRYVSTDNAYVKADKIMVSPEVSGTILTIGAQDNQMVHKGDVLMTIDPEPFAIKVEHDKANLLAAEAQIEDLKARYRQTQAQLKSASINAQYYGTEYKRYAPLVKNGVVSKLSVEDIARQRGEANQTHAQVQQESASILAQLNGNPDIAVEDHPLYQMAKAEMDKSQRDLEKTKVVAPADGMTGNMPNVGAYAIAMAPSVSIVSQGNEWVEANFKETELTNVKPGQPVTIKVDTYPHHEWTGTVDSIAPATGSEFSVLPAENATGNWVKVTQRVTVRIKLNHKADDAQYPLRAGMSADITIDIGFHPHLSRLQQRT